MIERLFKAGVHFGHIVSRWCPKMAPYIWGHSNKVHLIDVSKTAHQMKRAKKFLSEVTQSGKQVLWVGTKKPAQEVIKRISSQTKMPYVYHRWIGGTLSNSSQVKKSITKLLHFEDVISKTKEVSHYTKKELNVFDKMAQRLQKSIGGIVTLKWPVGAIVIVDVVKEQAALKEAVKMGVPVVALVDTNSDPSLVDFVIPANDDAPQSIACILDYLSEGVQEGVELFAKESKKKATEVKKDDSKKVVKTITKKVDSSKKTTDKKTAVKSSEKKVASDDEAKKTVTAKSATKDNDKKEIKEAKDTKATAE
jgi:small subunit ribosomal protein S2